MTVVGSNDIAFSFDCDRLFFDLQLNEDGSDLKGAIILENAIPISLFTDRRTGSSDKIPNSKGWPGDALAEEDTPLIGSKNWQLLRGKTTDNALIDAVTFSNEALKWLIDDKIVASFDVRTSYLDKVKGVMVFDIDATMPTGENLRFQFVWDQISNQITSTNIS